MRHLGKCQRKILFVNYSSLAERVSKCIQPHWLAWIAYSSLASSGKAQTRLAHCQTTFRMVHQRLVVWCVTYARPDTSKPPNWCGLIIQYWEIFDKLEWEGWCVVNLVHHLLVHVIVNWNFNVYLLLFTFFLPFKSYKNSSKIMLWFAHFNTLSLL